MGMMNNIDVKLQEGSILTKEEEEIVLEMGREEAKEFMEEERRAKIQEEVNIYNEEVEDRRKEDEKKYGGSE